MNQERMKQQLVRDREWLRSLYTADSTSKAKRILTYSSDAQLETLAKYLHFLSNGLIKMPKENFERLEKKHMTLIKKTFETKRGLRQFLSSERLEKIKKFTKLKPVMSHLLYTLFNT